MTDSQPLRIGTFNIRYDSAVTSRDIGEKPWSQRRTKVAETILFHRFDVIGLQEALYNQIEDLESLLGSNWAWIGVGRKDGKKKGEFTPIFYKKNRLRLEEWTSFWLSEAPEIPGSIGWDAELPRVATQVRLFDVVSEKTFCLINTHFDHYGKLARINSAKLLLSKAQNLFTIGVPSTPIILTGDYNFEENSDAYKIITGQESVDSKPQFYFADTRYNICSHHPTTSFGHSNTFTGFTPDTPSERIDYILINESSVIESTQVRNYQGKNIKVLNHGVVENRYDDGLFISDHRAVIVDLEFLRG